DFAYDVLGRGTGSLQMKIVQHDAAVLGTRPPADHQHLIEGGRTREPRRKHFEQHVRAALRRLATQQTEFLRQLRYVRAVVAKIADFYVTRTESFGRIE